MLSMELNEMIDIHTHILHGIDDGSENLELSIDQIKIMANSGVTSIVFTPHYIRNSYHNTKEVILPKFAELSVAVKKTGVDITLYHAAEVYLEKNIINDIEKENFSINNTEYVLVETSLSAFPADLYDILYNLVKKGYKPILAHPERYSNIAMNFKLAEDMMYRNIYLQMNAGSIMGQYGNQVRKTALKMLEHGFVHFLASDNHCKSDNYILPQAVDFIKKKYDNYFAELLTEINPRKMLNNEKIEYFYLKADNIGEKRSGIFNRFLSLFK